MERALEGLSQAAKAAARERKIEGEEDHSQRKRLSMIRKRSREVYRPSGRIFKHQETALPRDSFKPS